jgi:hypothetical protein
MLATALDPAIVRREDDLHRLGVEARLRQSGRSGVPVHSAVPTAPVNHGWLIGRGSSSARPSPAHSNVTRSVRVGRRCNSASERVSGVPTRPSIASRQVAESSAGMS